MAKSSDSKDGESMEDVHTEPDSELAEVVPRAAFIEDVAGFVNGRPVEEVLGEMRAQHQRYQLVEQELLQRRLRMQVKEPEIRKCLDAVNLLLQRREAGDESTVLHFSLSDHVYALARVANVSSVNLWLGADVMLEYSLEAAQELLARQLEGCRAQLQGIQSDFDFVKDQMTTMEVSIARVYNYDVMQRRSELPGSAAPP